MKLAFNISLYFVTKNLKSVQIFRYKCSKLDQRPKVTIVFLIFVFVLTFFIISSKVIFFVIVYIPLISSGNAWSIHQMLDNLSFRQDVQTSAKKFAHSECIRRTATDIFFYMFFLKEQPLNFVDIFSRCPYKLHTYSSNSSNRESDKSHCIPS